MLVTAEPGDPWPGEMHTNVHSVVNFSTECLRNPATPFHENIRLIMDLCFPQRPFDEQLRRIWRTNSVLCSAQVECGSVPRAVETACITNYLSHQLSLVPHALVAALGRKAQRRLLTHGILAFPALHPSCRKTTAVKRASWEALADKVKSRQML